MFLLCWINTFPSVSIHGRYIRKKNTHTEIQFALLRFLDHNQRCIQTVGHPNYTMTGIEKPHRHTHKNKYTEQIHFYVGGRGQGLREPGRKGGGRGTGDAREKKGRQAQEKFKNASFLYFCRKHVLNIRVLVSSTDRFVAFRARVRFFLKKEKGFKLL